MNLFLDFHCNVPRLGPGDSKCTEQALSMLGPLPNPTHVLDLGCGAGAQTLLLAQLMRCHITAVDLYDCFLDELRNIVARAGLQQQITPVTASMHELPFADASFDLLWSEGAIYHMGFAPGLQQLRRFLTDNGCFAVTELSWIKGNTPQDIRTYWEQAYPGIGSIATNVTHIETSGYTPLGHFILPPSAWLQNYYAPLEAKKQIFLQRHQHSAEAVAVVAEFEQEVALYHRGKDYYGYVFYLGKKVD